MGMLISESGSESSLKSVSASVGLSGLILCEQETIKRTSIKTLRFPFMVLIVAIKISKEKTNNNRVLLIGAGMREWRNHDT